MQLQDLKLELLKPDLYDDDFVSNIGKYIDLANEVNDEGSTRLAITLLEDRKDEIIDRKNKCLLHYFLSVAYSDIHTKTIAQTDKDWDWEQELVEKELENLRLAHFYISAETDKQIVSSILINLANRFDSLGRFILTMDFWNNAYQYSNSGMAAINTGNSLMYYGLNYLNEKKYQIAFIQLAHKYFTYGLAKPLYAGITEQARERLSVIEREYKSVLNIKLNKVDFLVDYSDMPYSKWCSENGLWLNPLSHINSNIECNKDDLQLLHFNKEYNDFFNAIKADYLFCRKQFFNSIFTKNKEEAEHLKKSSFKNAYSIFDKISYLLNGILDLQEITNPKLNFNRIWYKKLNRNQGIEPTLIQKRDLMLRALYWVSKDIYINEDGFKNIVEPKAKELNNIRNFIEHKSFKFGERLEGKFTLQIPISEFDENEMKLFKLVRECLFYIAYLKLT